MYSKQIVCIKFYEKQIKNRFVLIINTIDASVFTENNRVRLLSYFFVVFIKRI